jgi:phosphoserine phosphatase
MAESAEGATGAGDEPAVLIRVSGPDKPGITTGLMTLLSSYGVDVEDVEQVLVRDILTLAVAISDPGPAGEAIGAQLQAFGADRGLTVSLQPIPAQPAYRGSTEAVIVLGHAMGEGLTPRELAAVTSGIAGAGGNIVRILRLARYPVHAYEFQVRGTPPGVLATEMGRVSAEMGLDLAIQPGGIERKAKRLVVLDVDSTLIQNEVIELLAAEAGCEDRVRKVTESAMEGEIDFAEALRERVALLEGITVDQMEQARSRMELTPGARTFIRTLKRLGYTVGIVSGGFTYFTDALKEQLGLDHAFANELEVVDGRLTGRVLGDVVDRFHKARLLREVAEAECIPLSQTVAIGDGANDLDMLSVAGLGVAFNAKAVVQQAADTTVNVPYLDAILFLLGVTRDEVLSDNEPD